MRDTGDKSGTGSHGWLAAAALLVVAVAAGVYFRFAHLGDSPLWRDEASFAFMATASLGDLFEILRRDVHAPLYFLLLKAWVSFAGTSEAGLRSLGAVLSLLCIPATYWFARPILGTVAASAAALLVAVNPGQIESGTDLMVYPLLTLLALLAMGMLDRALVTNRRGLWIAHTLLLTAMVYTHMWALLLWTSAGFFVLILLVVHYRRHRSWPTWFGSFLVANAAAVVLSVPWLMQVVGQAGSRTMDHLLYTPGFVGMLNATFDYWFNSWQVILVVVALAVALPALAVQTNELPGSGAQRFRWGLLLALLLAFGSQVIAFEMAYWKAAYLQRYTIPSIPFFILLLASSLACLRPRWLSIALGVFIAVYPIVPLDRRFDGIRAAQRCKSPLAHMAARVEAEAQPGDVIFIFPEPYASTFNWYYRGNLPQVCWPAVGRVESVDWHTYADRVEDPESVDRALAYLLERLEPGGKVWMVQSRGFQGTRGGKIDYGDALARIMQVLRTRLAFRQELSEDFMSIDPKQDNYGGLEQAALVVLENVARQPR
ncbi:MAG: glycosyltransferase family 39 protein [Phycisphaerales bacterium]|nr:MAG: glycosyltransferase family 39 protein [Phycisphaerales bacterium]